MDYYKFYSDLAIHINIYCGSTIICYIIYIIYFFIVNWDNNDEEIKMPYLFKIYFVFFAISCAGCSITPNQDRIDMYFNKAKKEELIDKLESMSKNELIKYIKKDSTIK